MTQTIERRIGEYGNPIRGILNNGNDSLVIAPGSVITLMGINRGTGVVVINAGSVQIIDIDTREVSYSAQAPELDAACTLDLTFKIDPPADHKPTDIPDKRANRIFLVIW